MFLFCIWRVFVGVCIRMFAIYIHFVFCWRALFRFPKTKTAKKHGPMSKIINETGFYFPQNKRQRKRTVDCRDQVKKTCREHTFNCLVVSLVATNETAYTKYLTWWWTTIRTWKKTKEMPTTTKTRQQYNSMRYSSMPVILYTYKTLFIQFVSLFFIFIAYFFMLFTLLQYRLLF